jgi:hypothetical protein
MDIKEKLTLSPEQKIVYIKQAIALFSTDIKNQNRGNGGFGYAFCFVFSRILRKDLKIHEYHYQEYLEENNLTTLILMDLQKYEPPEPNVFWFCRDVAGQLQRIAILKTELKNLKNKIINNQKFSKNERTGF